MTRRDPRAWLEWVASVVLPGVLLVWTLWRLRSFTLDDAFISFRYAENAARGLGLVYGAGERVEGYSNFLWTLLLAFAAWLHLDLVTVAKLLGAACGLGLLATTYGLSSRARPISRVPCLATWLVATSATTFHAAFGLETTFFTLLLTAATLFFIDEEHLASSGAVRPKGQCTLPWAGLFLAGAAITRPEGIVYALALAPFGRWHDALRRNAFRLALPGAVLAAHVAFRCVYYGHLLPNTYYAKLGDTPLWHVPPFALGYVARFARHEGPLLLLAVFGCAWAFATRRRDLQAMASMGAAALASSVPLSDDWMPADRLLAPFAPFAFVLCCVLSRTLVESGKHVALRATFVLLLGYGGWARWTERQELSRQILTEEQAFWDGSVGTAARWLAERDPGLVATASIGFVGYATNYPILDFVGLVDPVIGTERGGHLQKPATVVARRFFETSPRYAIMHSRTPDCTEPWLPGLKEIRQDARFESAYELVVTNALTPSGHLCIWQLKTP
jgi:hypothetical protein